MQAHAIYCAKRAVLAAAIIFGVFALVPCGAQAQQDNSAKPAAKQAGGQTPQTLDARIAEFHDKLAINGSQESAWNNLAQVMRENAAKMEARIAQWAKQAGKMTAVESLRAQSDMAAENAQSFHKLMPAFETLYDTLSAGQKKTADAMFANPQGQPGKKTKK
jgi:uncharacterized coiled-coil protein SlyX